MESLSGYVGHCVGGPKDGELLASPFNIVYVAKAGTMDRPNAVGAYHFTPTERLWRWQEALEPIDPNWHLILAADERKG